MWTVFIVIGIFCILMVYYEIKKRLKRNYFNKEQYEHQKEMTHRYYVYTTTSEPKQIKKRLCRMLPVDDSFKSNFLGGNYTISENREDKISFLHHSKLTTSGDGDEFIGSVTFRPRGDMREAVLQIERWREHDGVTRRAGIRAMEEFLRIANDAILKEDPQAQMRLL